MSQMDHLNSHEILNQNSTSQNHDRTSCRNDYEGKNSLSVYQPDNYQFSSVMNSKRLATDYNNERPDHSPAKSTEQLIIQSIAELTKIAELAKINEENDSVSDQSSSLLDPSPKVNVGILDTWEKYTPRNDDT